MNSATHFQNEKLTLITCFRYLGLIRMLIAGIVFPLGFAPFHLPGLVLLSLAFFYYEIYQTTLKKAFFKGFIFGLGMFGTGVSWVFISMNEYGQMHTILAGLATLLFIVYLSLFPALMAFSFKGLQKYYRFSPSLLFCILWVIMEYARATLFTGFPWLRVGTALIDTPIQYVAPILGIYGLSLIGCLGAILLANIIKLRGLPQKYCMLTFLLLFIIPWLFKNQEWTQVDHKPLSTAIIQANLSMREKWDDDLFEEILDYYHLTIKKLAGTKLIVMPETAIPVPDIYVTEYLEELGEFAQKTESSILTGILQADDSGELLSNTLLGLGHAKGRYAKQHLVPFGEYTPKFFKPIYALMNFPEFNTIPGINALASITVNGNKIASLICYEIAYQEILRKQMPDAKWIVAISDNGWFGHSLASWQQLQMAQMLSLLTGRYQIVSNNDGLSSVINHQGKIVASLSAFSTGILNSEIYPAEGLTPWVRFGDKPVLGLCLLGLCLGLLFRKRKVRS